MKDEAARVRQDATEAGEQVAGTARDEAKKVASEAGHQARTLMDDARGELTTQARQQQDRLATGLHSFSGELLSMADNATQSGFATDLARQGADRIDSAASWLRDREPQEVIAEMKSFARRRPGMFLAVAAGAGVLAGRLTRNLQQGDGGAHRAETGGSGRMTTGPSTVDDVLPALPATRPTSPPPPGAGEMADPLGTPAPNRGDIR
jgi:hypothetical protein